MGRKALGKEPITRRLEPKSVALLEMLEGQGIGLDQIINASVFLATVSPGADSEESRARALVLLECAKATLLGRVGSASSPQDR